MGLIECKYRKLLRSVHIMDPILKIGEWLFKNLNEHLLLTMVVVLIIGLGFVAYTNYQLQRNMLDIIASQLRK